MILVEQIKTGRNDNCPCGSNKKYKKCCLNNKRLPAQNPTKKEEIDDIDNINLNSKEITKLIKDLDKSWTSNDVTKYVCEIGKLIYLKYHPRLEKFWHSAILTFLLVKHQVFEDMTNLEIVERLISKMEKDSILPELDIYKYSVKIKKGNVSIKELEEEIQQNYNSDKFNSSIFGTTALKLILSESPMLGLPFMYLHYIIESSKEFPKEDKKFLNSIETSLKEEYPDVYNLFLDIKKLQVNKQEDSLEFRKNKQEIQRLRNKLKTANLNLKKQRISNKVNSRSNEVEKRLREKIKKFRSVISNLIRKNSELKLELRKNNNKPEIVTITNQQIKESDSEEIIQNSISHPLRIPELNPDFCKDLYNVPKKIAQSAMRAIGHLCSGEEQAFYKCKPIKTLSHIFRYRIGDHRMIFSLTEDKIIFKNLISRQNLIKYIKEEK